MGYKDNSFHCKDETFSKAVVVVGTVLTAVGSFGITAQLLSPGTILGALNYFIVGSILMITHSDKLQQDIYKSLPDAVREFTFEKSLLELLRNKSRYIQLSAFMCACLTLPSEKLDRLQHDLPNTFDHCKQRGLWNVLKSSKPLYCNPNPKILTVDVSSCAVGREGGYSQNFTQHVAKEVLGSMIRNAASPGVALVSKQLHSIFTEWLPCAGILGASSACYWMLLLGADSYSFTDIGVKLMGCIRLFIGSNTVYAQLLQSTIPNGEYYKQFAKLIGLTSSSIGSALSLLGGATTIGLGVASCAHNCFRICSDPAAALPTLLSTPFVQQNYGCAKKLKLLTASVPLMVHKLNEDTGHNSHNSHSNIYQHNQDRSDSSDSSESSDSSDSRNKFVYALLLAVCFSRLPKSVIDMCSTLLLLPTTMKQQQLLQQEKHKQNQQVGKTTKTTKEQGAGYSLELYSWKISHALVSALSLRLDRSSRLPVNLNWLTFVLHGRILQYVYTMKNR